MKTGLIKTTIFISLVLLLSGCSMVTPNAHKPARNLIEQFPERYNKIAEAIEITLEEYKPPTIEWQEGYKFYIVGVLEKKEFNNKEIKKINDELFNKSYYKGWLNGIRPPSHKTINWKNELNRIKRRLR